jgi:hypothetical protein
VARYGVGPVKASAATPFGAGTRSACCRNFSPKYSELLRIACCDHTARFMVLDPDAHGGGQNI